MVHTISQVKGHGTRMMAPLVIPLVPTYLFICASASVSSPGGLAMPWKVPQLEGRLPGASPSYLPSALGMQTGLQAYFITLKPKPALEG